MPFKRFFLWIQTNFVVYLIFICRELRLIEAVTNPHVCEKILEYNIHAERKGSLRFAKGRSETMETLEGLVYVIVLSLLFFFNTNNILIIKMYSNLMKDKMEYEFKVITSINNVYDDINH